MGLNPKLLAIPLGLATVLAACSAAEESLVPEEGDFGAPVVVDGKADGVDVPAFGPLPEGASLDEGFAVLFAPDDPVATTELAMIQRVRDARATDPADYSDGDNPFRVRYAVYNLRNPQLIDALADAADEGVDVQVLIDEDQLDPERTWNQADEILVERGFELVTDSRDLTDATRLTADMIGIHHSGLMHFKTRIFEAPGFEAVISGSMNPGDNALLNEETLHLIRDPRLVERYRAAYASILAGDRIANEWDDSAAVNVLFTPSASGPRANERLFRWIAEEDEAILLMVFSLRDIEAAGTERSLVELLGDKARGGVPVYVITDRKQSDGVDANGNPLYWNDDTEDDLRAAGVHVYEATNHRTEFCAMHHKVGILGLTSPRVITDAANWTFSGLGSATRVARNYESQLFVDTAALDGGRTGRRYLAQWLRVLSRYADQSAADGEPSYGEVADLVTSLPGWPAQDISFSVEVETEFGETAFIRGDLAELGEWGFAHGGVELGTDAERYPLWESLAPVSMPLATPFAWKIVASWSDGATRWENGDDRTSTAMPEPLVPDDALTLRGTFR
jgi:hypothetical protein